MKNILYKCIIGIAVFCLILLSVLKIADIHRDGIIIRDGIYNVCTVEAAGPNLVVWDVEWGQAVIGANVHLWEASYGSPQKFHLKNIGWVYFMVMTECVLQYPKTEPNWNYRYTKTKKIKSGYLKDKAIRSILILKIVKMDYMLNMQGRMRKHILD